MTNPDIAYPAIGRVCPLLLVSEMGVGFGPRPFCSVKKNLDGQERGYADNLRFKQRRRQKRRSNIRIRQSARGSAYRWSARAIKPCF